MGLWGWLGAFSGFFGGFLSPGGPGDVWVDFGVSGWIFAVFGGFYSCQVALGGFWVFWVSFQGYGVSGCIFGVFWGFLLTPDGPGGHVPPRPAPPWPGGTPAV